MSKVFLDLSYPKNCSRIEWKKAMEQVREGKGGLIHLLENLVQTRSDTVRILVWGSRPDVNTWLDLLLELNPEVSLEVQELKRVIRISFIQNRVNEHGEYVITLSELQRSFGTSEGVVKNSWFWSAKMGG